MADQNLANDITVSYQQKSPILGEIAVKVTGNHLDQLMETAFLDLQKRVKEKGFRPGKVPLTLIKKKYHFDVLQDAYNKLVLNSYIEATKKENIPAVGEPQIIEANAANWKPGDQVEYKANIELFPEVKLKKVKGFSITSKKAEVKSEDIEKVLTNLRDQNAQMQPVSIDREIKEGDFVEIDFVGSLDGEVLEDAKAQNFLLEVVDNHSLPEFKENLIGEKAGKEKDIQVVYPEDFNNKKIAGKKVDFNVKIHEIKEKRLPELDTEFAKLHDCETVDQLKEKIRDNLKKEMNTEIEAELRNHVIDEFLAANPLDIPNTLKQNQLQVIYRDLLNMLQNQRFSDSLIQEYMAKNEADLKNRAEKEVKLGLLLEQLIKVEKIEFTEADLTVKKQSLADSMQTTVDKIDEFYQNSPEKLDNLKYQLTREKALDFLVDNSKVTYQK